ncbi:hypothetical protein AAES_126702 [Amazona aestiva]|uniref:Uncharacterized protein n=1 Tax=Amazona aestiva TaxID=12930 RepID=A0A0Q3P8T3_AMAAE|nr:hypothetical protein AAES_126702 [Amazona aestiva]
MDKPPKHVSLVGEDDLKKMKEEEGLATGGKITAIVFDVLSSCLGVVLKGDEERRYVGKKAFAEILILLESLPSKCQGIRHKLLGEMATFLITYT